MVLGVGIGIETGSLEVVVEDLRLFAHILESIIKIEEERKARFDEIL